MAESGREMQQTGQLGKPPVHMVPAGTHFRSSSSAPAMHAGGAARASMPGSPAAPDPWVPRPAGTRFAARPAAPATGGSAPVARHFARSQADRSEPLPPRPSSPSPEETAAFIAAAKGEATDRLKPLAEKTEALEDGSRQVANFVLEDTDAMAAAAAEDGPRPAPESMVAPEAVGFIAATSRSRAPRHPDDDPVPEESGSRPPAGTGPVHRGRRPAASRARVYVARVLIVLGVILLLAAGVLLVRSFLGYRAAAESYESIQKTAIVEETDDEGNDIADIDFAALSQVSSDIVGWIIVPGTPINYPVVQGEDNNQYLRHLPDGTYNESGSIFMDENDTAPGLIDQQTTLYGHHMNDGSMFKAIDGTLDQDAFDRIQEVYYITPAYTYVLRPLLTAQVDETYVNARRATFDGDLTLTQYLQDMRAQASAVADDVDERIEDTSTVMTLVTCAGEIIPRTTRAAMVLTVDQVIPRS